MSVASRTAEKSDTDEAASTLVSVADSTHRSLAGGRLGAELAETRDLLCTLGVAACLLVDGSENSLRGCGVPRVRCVLAVRPHGPLGVISPHVRVRFYAAHLLTL